MPSRIYIQLWAKDTENNWYDINVTGWGPPLLIKLFGIDGDCSGQEYVDALPDALENTK